MIRSTTPQARQSAAEKSWKGPTRAGNPKSISAADSPACERCDEGRRVYTRGLCRTCFYAARRAGETLLFPPCRECGRQLEPHRHQRGLCGACYQRHRASPVGGCHGCHTEFPLRTNGLCNACYQRQQRAEQRTDPNVHTRQLLAQYLRRAEKRLTPATTEPLAVKHATHLAPAVLAAQRDRRHAAALLAAYMRRVAA